MNFVSLIGRIRGYVNETTRLIEVARPEMGDDIENLLIPCKYWTKDAHCLLTKIKEGTMLIIRGRIDKDDKVGIFIIVEQITVVK